MKWTVPGGYRIKFRAYDLYTHSIDDGRREESWVMARQPDDEFGYFNVNQFALTSSNTFIGEQTITGSLLVSGSTTQIGNNTLTGNTIMSGTLGAISTVSLYGDLLLSTGMTLTAGTGTLSLGFEGRGSVYGTLAGGQMFMFPKVPSLKAVYMGTISYGQVYKTPFIGSALIAGGMYDLKFGKRIDIKLMTLFVYSPYVSYYNDLVLKSPYVILPSLGTNISITKRFKFNINAGGAWAIKVNTLNYTITCGTRLLVGQ